MNLLMINDAELELHSMATEIPWQLYGVERVFTANSADQARQVLLREQPDHRE